VNAVPEVVLLAISGAFVLLCWLALRDLVSRWRLFFSLLSGCPGGQEGEPGFLIPEPGQPRPSVVTPCLGGLP